MRFKTLLLSITILCGVLFAGILSATGQVAIFGKLEGDKNALALADKMLAALGSKAAWAQACTIIVNLRGYSTREKELWFESKGKTVDRIISWTPEGGWELNGGIVSTMETERYKFELEYWKRQAVVIFHRLAKGVSARRVEMGTEEYSFDV